MSKANSVRGWPHELQDQHGRLRNRWAERDRRRGESVEELARRYANWCHDHGVATVHVFPGTRHLFAGAGLEIIEINKEDYV